MESANIKKSWAILLLTLFMVTASASDGAARGIDWNEKSIKWQDYNAGLKAGKHYTRPVLLVFYADW